MELLEVVCLASTAIGSISVMQQVCVGIMLVLRLVYVPSKFDSFHDSFVTKQDNISSPSKVNDLQ